MSDPVEEGREALNPWFGYPWYDAKTDGVRRVEVPQSRSLNEEGSAIDLSTPLLQWAAWVAIVLALVALLYLLYRAFRDRHPEDALDHEAETGTAAQIEALPIPAETGPIDLLAEARRLYEQGEYGRAIIYFFSHELVQLDRRHIIRLTRGKTNRQYLREVGARNALAELFEQTMRTFEAAYFGRHEIDRTQFEACWRRLDEFNGLLEASP